VALLVQVIQKEDKFASAAVQVPSVLVSTVADLVDALQGMGKFDESEILLVCDYSNGD
jgi:hypothetical protein